MGGENDLKALPQGIDTNALLRQVLPRLNRAEEVLLSLITVEVRLSNLLLARVLHNAPSKLQHVRDALNHVHDVLLGAFIHDVRLGEYTQGPPTLLVHLLSHLQDELSCHINVGGNNGEHDRARVLHVLEDHVLHKLLVGLGSDVLGDALEDTRDVDDREVLLIGAGDFDAQNIRAKGLLGGAVDFHDVLNPTHDVGEGGLIKRGEADLLPGADGVDVALVSILAGNDRHSDRVSGITAEGDLSCKAGAEAAVARKGQAGEALEDGRLAARLITDDNDLRKVNVMADVAGEECIDFGEHDGIRQGLARGARHDWQS